MFRKGAAVSEEFYGDCAKSARKAESRASNLAGFAVITAALGILSVVGYLLAAIAAKEESDKSRISDLAPLALGTAMSLFVIAAVLLGLSSLVDIAAKRLVLTVETRGSQSRSSDVEPPPSAEK